MEIRPGRKPTVVLPHATVERLDKLPMENVRRDQRRAIGLQLAAELYFLLRDLKVNNGHLKCMTCNEPVQLLVGQEVRGIEVGHQLTCPRHFEHALVRRQSQSAA